MKKTKNLILGNISLATLVLDNPVNSDSFTEFFQKISIFAVEIGIPIATLFIIYSGLRLVMARGNEEAIKKAKDGLLWSVIGAGILIGAWAIIKILESTVTTVL